MQEIKTNKDLNENEKKLTSEKTGENKDGNCKK